MTSTRPLTCPFSRVGSGPRALLRLLQIHVLHEHDHGPLEHPDRRVCVRDDCLLRTRVSPDRGPSPKELEVRGRRTPLFCAPRGDCSPRRLRPNLGPLRAPPVAVLPLSPCPERRGERGRPPSSSAEHRASHGALAWRHRGQGRVTPHLREEAGRPPTRGTFHPEAVRERTAAAPGQRADPEPHQRLFHRPGKEQGDACSDPDGSIDRRGMNLQGW